MNIFVIFQVLLSLAYVAYLVYIYSLKNISIFVKGIVFITWLLSFSIVFILPLDIYNTISTDSASNQSYNTILIVWKLIYWTNFIFTWLVLPIIQQYQQAGQFDWKSKLKRSIINNLIIYGIFAGIGIIFLVYLLIRGNFNPKHLSSVLVAISNVFGMVLVVLLLSHGIVDIPKKLWRQKKSQITLKYNQYHASEIIIEKQNLLQELQLKAKQVLAHQNLNGKTMENQIIFQLIPQNLIRSWSKSVPKFQNTNLITLHKQVKKMILDLNRLQSKWQNLQVETFRIEDIHKDRNSEQHVIQSVFFKKYNMKILNILVWIWYCKLKPIVMKFLFVILTTFAVAVVIAEISIFLNWISILNIFIKVHLFQSFILIDIYLLVPLFYIALCVFYGLFKMKLAGLYGLYQNHHTDAPSLIFTAINCSRVSTPLCYNFLQLVSVQDSAFSEVMGTVDISPIFGRTFNIIFPILLLILITFNAFDVYSKLLKAIGLQRFQFEQNFNHENIADGRKKLEKARIELEKKIINKIENNSEQTRTFQMDGQLQMQQKLADRSELNGSKKNNKPYFNTFKNMNEIAKIIDM